MCKSRSAHEGKQVGHLFTSRSRKLGGEWRYHCCWCGKPKDE
jgi:hypothetical protein